MTDEPFLDIVIAVHTAQRPVERAVGSALADPGLPVRVTVVAHGIAAESLRPRLAGISDERLRVIEHHDGIASPAGPMNAGMLAATARYVTVIGSDDYYEAGALQAALSRTTEGAEVVILPIRRDDGARVSTPLPRWRHTRRLHPARDRLFTRTAPLAVVSRELMLADGAPFTEGLSSGEDLAISTRLWAGGARIDYDAAAPAYVIGADAPDRVTAALRSLGDELRAVELVLGDPAVRAYPRAVRRSLAVKVARVHVIGAVARRHGAEPTTGERTVLARLARELSHVAPGYAAALSRAESGVIEALAHDLPWIDVVDRDRERDEGSWRTRVLPTRLVDSLRTDAVLRRFVRYRLEPGGGR